MMMKGEKTAEKMPSVMCVARHLEIKKLTKRNKHDMIPIVVCNISVINVIILKKMNIIY